MLNKLRSKLLLSLAIAAAIGVAFSLYANTGALKESFSSFDYRLLPVILLFPVINYLIRFARWGYYLRVLNIDIPRPESFGIFISSLSMSVTPGKMGEVVKSYFLKSLHSVPISKSAPIIFAERMTDFLGLLVIAIAGAYAIGQQKDVVLIVAVIFVAAICVIASRRLSMWIIRQLERVRFLSKWVKNMEVAYESSRSMLSGRALAVSTFLGFLAWFSECVGFFFVLDGLGVHLKILSASFIYAFSIVVGAISFLPGGLGATETSLAGLLILARIPKSAAVAATFIVRASTLWFAVIIGIGMLSFMQKRYVVVVNDKPENSRY